MKSSRSCSHCHTMNPTTERYCRDCGHEAHQSRMLCQCPRCQLVFGAVRTAQALQADVDAILNGKTD